MRRCSYPEIVYAHRAPVNSFCVPLGSPYNSLCRFCCSSLRASPQPVAALASTKRMQSVAMYANSARSSLTRGQVPKSETLVAQRPLLLGVYLALVLLALTLVLRQP